MMMIKISHFLLIALIQINVKLVKNQNLNPSFDINEINNYKYQIDIGKSIISENQIGLDQNQNKNNILIKSVHGQLYQCTLPDILNSLTDDNGFDEADKLNNFNFTLINERVVDYLEGLKKLNICLYKNTGWWTYEFCFNSHVNQYHKLQNGSVVGDIIRLGNFSENYDWLQANKTRNYPSISNVFYHEQYYGGGSMCELNQKPRRVIAKIFCDESAITESIDMISEIETCVYEIYINSLELCNIPNFSKKSNNYDINCNPVLSSLLYDKYTIKMQDLEAAKLLKLKNDNEIKNQINFYNENNLNKGQKDDVLQLQNIVDQLKEDVEVEKNSLNDLIQIDKHILSETNEKFELADDFFDKISNNLNKLIDDSDLTNSIKVKDTMFGNKNKDIYGTDDEDFIKSADLNGDASSNNQIKIDKDTLLNTINQNEEQLKSLEDKITEKLNQAKSTNLKIKGSQIKVKIITLDQTGQSQIKTLTEEETNGITSLISSLFESDKDYEKMKSTNSNYNFIYNSNSIDNLNDLTVDENNQKDDENPIIFY